MGGNMRSVPDLKISIMRVEELCFQAEQQAPATVYPQVSK